MFDCCGTLVNFEIERTIKEVFGARLPPERAEQFIKLAAAFRFDEALGTASPTRTSSATPPGVLPSS